MYLNNSRIQRYGVTILAVVVALTVLLVLPSQETIHIPLSLLFGAVIAIAWYAGVGARQMQEALRQSEERLQLVLESADLGMWDYDPSCDRMVWSERAKIMLGFAPACDLTYEIFLNALHPEDRELVQQAIAKIDARSEYFNLEFRTRANGTVRWIAVLGRIYRNSNSEVRVTGVVADITERKLCESRFKRIFDSNIIGMNFFSPNGEILQANQAFLNIIGYTQQDLQANCLNLQALTPLEYELLEKQAMQEIRQKGICTPYEKEYIRKDSSRISALVSATIDDCTKDGICFVLDLSDRKQLENRLRQQAAQLERANHTKDEFLAILSHELRTPLNAILNWAHLLRCRQLSQETTARALETIERNARLQTQAIEDLLDVSQILQGKLRLNSYPVNLASTIKVAIAAVQSSALEKSIHLQFQISDGGCDRPSQKARFSTTNDKKNNIKPIKYQLQNPQFFVSGDSTRLQQVVWNLLSNAIKFTPHGGRVTVALLLEGGNTESSRACIQVRDTGIGISPDFLPCVFDCFCQADSSFTRAYGGLGLGLTIVHHLVEFHGGEIYADSEGEGKGATFTIYLPLLKESKELEKQSELVNYCKKI